MKTFPIILAALCSVSTLFAQHAAVTFSPRTDCEEEQIHKIILFNDGSAKYLCYDRSIENIKVASYTEGLKKTEKTIKVSSWGEGDVSSSEIVAAKNHKYFFASAMPKKKECTLSYVPITPGFGTADVTPQKVMTLPSLMGSGEYLSRGAQGDVWKFAISGDSTKILGKCELLNTERNPDAGVSVYVWSEDMKVLWKQDFVLPRKRMRLEEVTYHLSNSGNDVYMLYKFVDNYNGPDDKPKYHYELARFSKGATAPVIANIDFKGLFFNDLTAAEDATGTMVVAGIVSESFTDNFSPGFALLKMVSDGKKMEAYGKGVYTLSEAELKRLLQLKADRKASKLDQYGKYEVRNPYLHLLNMKFKADGILNVYLTPEYYSVSGLSNADGSARGKRFADDIYAFHIGTSGSLNEVLRVPRLSSDRDAIIASGPDGADYFYILENPANLSRDLKKESPEYIDDKNLENNAWDLVKLNSDGSTKRVKLLPYDIIPAEKKKFHYYVKSIIFISPNECIGALQDLNMKGNANYHQSSVYFRAKLDW
ncbi:MAG: hypothetical protein JWO03_2341 [Bacteroidetes bacterium]|nr:hypothetical protein [Bacteroidota bacterium]